MAERSGDPIFFDAVLRPAPPLSAAAMMAVLLGVATVNFLFGILFIVQGAWPVLPFLGADVLLLAWAFRASRRAARAHEHIVVRVGEVMIVRQPYRGQALEVRLNPYWLNVRLEEDVEPARRLFLSSHGRSVEIGGFLSPDERESLAAGLKAALLAARNYRPD